MKNKITRLDRIIIRIMLQNNLSQMYYNKDTYNIGKVEKNTYYYKINNLHISFFHIEGNKIIINQ